MKLALALFANLIIVALVLLAAAASQQPGAWSLVQPAAAAEAERRAMLCTDADTRRLVETDGTSVREPLALGACFSRKQWSQGEVVRADVRAAWVDGFGALDCVEGQGVNLDMQLGLYDVSDGTARLLSTLPYTGDYGDEAHGFVLNATFTGCNIGEAARTYSPALTLGGVVCPVARCAVGAVLVFHHGPYARHIQYAYGIHAVLH